jgi:hypothetical protein
MKNEIVLAGLVDASWLRSLNSSTGFRRKRQPLRSADFIASPAAHLDLRPLSVGRTCDKALAVLPPWSKP